MHANSAEDLISDNEISLVVKDSSATIGINEDDIYIIQKFAK